MTSLPKTFLGYPVRVSDDVPKLGPGSIRFGDMSKVCKRQETFGVFLPDDKTKPAEVTTDTGEKFLVPRENLTTFLRALKRGKLE